jgi:predicted amidohydrolase YtcJ
MQIRRREVLLGGSAVALSACLAKPAAEAADLILHNGQVLTVDPKFSKASSVAVRNGLIVAVGGPEVLDSWRAASTIDLAGRTLMPGFIDCHCHIYSLAPRAIEPATVKSIAELEEVLSAKAQQSGTGE